MPLFSRFALCACLTVALALPTRGGEGGPVSRPGLLHLDMATAIRLALEKNYTIQVQQMEPKIAEEHVTGELGVFDPVLQLAGSRDYVSGRSRLNDLGVRNDQTLIGRQDTLLDSTLSGKTPLGTQYRFGLSSIRARPAGQLFDEYTTGPVAEITQPLLRGAGLAANLAAIRIARTNVEISEWELRQRIIDTVTTLVYVYNDLHFAAEDQKVAVRSRELARQLLQDNTRRAQIGVMSPLDITTARAEVAAREEEVILAERSRRDNETLLKQLVTNELEPMLQIGVEIDPPPFTDRDVDVHAGIRDALEIRPDYRQELLTLRNRHINVAFTQNEALPRLDLVASLEYLGFDKDFANSLGRITSGDSLHWNAGAVFSIPLGNHAAKGDLNAARLEAARILLDLKRLEQQMVVDVDLAAGQVISDRARITSTVEASRLAKESLDAGEQRLRAGTGTTFEVLELQKKLADAESAELRARADHNKAVAEFNRKTGRTLEIHRIDFR